MSDRPTRRQGLSVHLEYERMKVRHALASTALLLPMSLLFASGPLRLAGALYAMGWLLLAVPSSALYLGLILDAVLIVGRRRPVLLPNVLQATQQQRRGNAPSRRVVRSLRLIMSVSAWISPLGNLAFSALYAAMRLRPAAARELFREAAAAKDAELRVSEPMQAAAPTYQIEVLEREVCTVG